MKFLETEKSTIESCRTHWNLMNDEEFRSFKFLILNYKRGDEIILWIAELVPPKKVGPPV